MLTYSLIMELIATILLSVALIFRFTSPIDNTKQNLPDYVLEPTPIVEISPKDIKPTPKPVNPTIKPVPSATPFVLMTDCKLENGETKRIPTIECLELKRQAIQNNQQTIEIQKRNPCVVGDKTYTHMSDDECKKAQDEEAVYQAQQEEFEEEQYQAFIDENKENYKTCINNANDKYNSTMNTLANLNTAESSIADQALRQKNYEISICEVAWEEFVNTYIQP